MKIIGWPYKIILKSSTGHTSSANFPYYGHRKKTGNQWHYQKFFLYGSLRCIVWFSWLVNPGCNSWHLYSWKVPTKTSHLLVSLAALVELAVLAVLQPTICGSVSISAHLEPLGIAVLATSLQVYVVPGSRGVGDSASASSVDAMIKLVAGDASLLISTPSK